MTTRASPYVGLTAYDEGDADFFFGREREIDLVTANLQASRLTILYGESGVGKSSILLAGVLRELHAEVAANLARLRREPVDPDDEPEKPPLAVALFRGPWAGERPLDQLLEAIHGAVEAATGDAVPPWQEDGDPVATLRAWTGHVRTILVVLDQFEEYFVHHDAESGPGTVAELLPAAAADVDLRVNFLLSIREDALAKLDRFKNRIPIMGNLLRIRFLGDAAAADAIEKPLARYTELVADGGGEYRAEPDLVAEVIRQVRARPDGRAGANGDGAATNGGSGVDTPVLQLVLTRLWEEEQRLSSRVLRLETFEERLESTERIMRSQLERAVAELDEGERDIAAASFRQLVTPSGSKFAQAVSDLAGFAGVSRAEVEPVLRKLESERILRAVAPPSGREETRYEILHDALGPTVLEWAASHQEHRAAEEAQREAEERTARARRRARIWAGVGILSLLLAAGVGLLAIYAVGQRREADDAKTAAERVRDLSDSRGKAARARALLGVDPHRAIGVALGGVEPVLTRDADEALREAVSQSRLRFLDRGEAPLNTVAVSPNGQWLLSVGEAGAAALINARSGLRHELEGHEGLLWSGSFDAGGRRALTAGEDGVARVWDVESGELAHELAHEAAVTAAAFVPGTPFVLTAGFDGTARLWDAATGKPVATLGHGTALATAAAARGGAWVATADEEGGVRLWRRPPGGWAGSPAPTHVLRVDGESPHEEWVNVVAFSPQGNLLATGSDDMTAQLWNVRTGKRLYVLDGHDRGVLDLAFSPDGASLATVADKSLHLWDTEEGFRYRRLQASNDWVTSVTFNPAGTLLLTSGAEGVARVWEASAGGLVYELRGHTDHIRSSTFTPNGASIATAGADRTTRLWDGSTGVELRFHDEWVHDVSASDDGRFVYTVGADSYIAKWDAETGRRVWDKWDWGDKTLNSVALDPTGRYLVAVSDDSTGVVWTTDPPVENLEDEPTTVLGDEGGHGADVHVVAVAADPRGDRRVATAGTDGLAILWTWTDGDPNGTDRELRRLEHGASVTSLAYTPDGRRLITGGLDGVARVWNPDSGARTAAFDQHRGTIGGVAVHPGGQLAATASEDWTVRVWQIGDGKQVAELGGGGGPLRAIAFNEAGTLVAAGGSSGATFVWAWPSGRLVARLKMHADLINALAFLPDGRIVSTSDDGTARIYACATCGSLESVVELAERRISAVG